MISLLSSALTIQAQNSVPTTLSLSNFEVGRGFILKGPSEPHTTQMIWNNPELKALPDSSLKTEIKQTLVFNTRTLAESFSLNANLKVRYYTFSASGSLQQIVNQVQSGTSLHLIITIESYYKPQIVNDLDTNFSRNAKILFKKAEQNNSCKPVTDVFGDYYISGIRKGQRIIVDFQFNSSELSKDYKSYMDFNAKYSAIAAGGSLSIASAQTMNELIQNSSVSYNIYVDPIPQTERGKAKMASLVGLSITSLNDYQTLLNAIKDFLEESIKNITYPNASILEYQFAETGNLCSVSSILPSLHTKTLDDINERYFLNEARIKNIDKAMKTKYASVLSKEQRGTLTSIAEKLTVDNNTLLKQFEICNSNDTCNYLIKPNYDFDEDKLLSTLDNIRSKYEYNVLTKTIDKRWKEKEGEVYMDRNRNSIVSINDTFPELMNRIITIDLKFSTFTPGFSNLRYAFVANTNSSNDIHDRIDEKICTSEECNSHIQYKYLVPSSGIINLEVHFSVIYSDLNTIQMTNMKTIIDY